MNKKCSKLAYAIVVVLGLILFACGTNTDITNPQINDSTGISVGTDETFDIVTWNIENFPKHNPETSDLLKTLLPALRADCIAIQEVSNVSAMYALVSNMPGYSYRISGSGDTQTAIIYNSTTVQIDSAAAIFGGLSNPFPRPPLLLKIRWQNQSLVLISLHLKAYGDNIIDESDTYDEEVRRRYACQLLDQYISAHFADKHVVIVGDMNDQIQEVPSTNVFNVFIDKPEAYLFADMQIAQNLNSQNCSYPKYTSHLDHILITNELSEPFRLAGNYVKTINMERYIAGGWTNYYNFISDHRPVAARFKFTQ